MRAAWLLAVVLALGGCKEHGGSIGTDATASAEHEAGRSIYNFRCYFCHGYSGDARTVASTYLEPRPRDFTAAAGLDRDRIADAVRHGRDGTAMKSFSGTLSATEIALVAAFVEREFVLARAPNTKYHTAANGWPDHDRYSVAFPFATGAIAPDTPWESLTPEQARGRRLYMASCVTCHDSGSTGTAGKAWEIRAMSYPPNASSCLSCHNREGVPADGVSPHGADAAKPRSPTYTGRPRPLDPGDPHEIHDRIPQIAGLTPLERRGEKVYQGNCAFCHAADGTGRNWIGAFVEPHPANFTDAQFMRRMTRERLRASIREGIEGTPMPAWKTVLTADEIDAVIAYISRAFHPPGDAPQPALTSAARR